MTGWMVLITIMLILVASAVEVYPGRAQTANRLTVAAIVSMILTLIVSALYRNNMFSDVLVVSFSLWLRAILAIAVSVGLALLLVWLVKGKLR